MRAELFTITPVLDTSTMDLGAGPEVIHRPMITVTCSEGDWEFHYPAAALADVLAHAENHSAAHPLPAEDIPEQPNGGPVT